MYPQMYPQHGRRKKCLRVHRWCGHRCLEERAKLLCPVTLQVKAEKKCGCCVDGPDRLLFFFFFFFCTGVFVPMDIRIPMRMLYFKLESWQTQLQQILVNSDTTGTTGNTGTSDTTGAFQDGLEHRITTTQNGNAKALFKKTGGGALIDGTVVAQEGGGGDGLTAAASSQYKKTNRLKKNETKEIHRIAVEGTTTNSIGNTTRHQSAVYHWIATKATEGSSEEEDSDSEAQQESTASTASTASTEQTEQQEAVPTAVGLRFENMRASILSSQVEGSGTLTTLVTGDAVW